MKFIDIAYVAHAANGALCKALGHPQQVSWAAARDSLFAGIDFLVQNPNATPADVHAEWVRHKQEAGWVHGPTKDVELKIHPCLVPWDQLPEDQQVKDKLFIAIVRALL